MLLHLWLRGLVLGFSIAAPVGPIGVLCIRRTLADGHLRGFITGLGAATADGCYGAVSAFGLAAISGLLVREQLWVRLVGGVFLLFLGLRTFSARPATETPATLTTAKAKAHASGGTELLRAYSSTLVLTLTNPLTILSFAAIFAGLGIGSAGGRYSAASALVLGVFCGSACWWLVLSSGVSLFRTRLTARALRAVNWLSGILLMGFGALALLSLLSL